MAKYSQAKKTQNGILFFKLLRSVRTLELGIPLNSSQVIGWQFKILEWKS